MTTIVTRAGKGSVLTHAEMDANFTNLNNDLAVHIDDTIDAHVSSAISYLPAGTGAVARDVQSKLREFVSVKDFAGVDNTGSTDSTAGLIAAFSNFGRVYVPEGNYLIAGAGPDAGGVEVTITKSLSVECHPNARFFTNSLDNDMLRFVVPSNGAGLPADGIEFEWRGGIIDQRNQKNSTVVPFIVEYPAVNPGVSATCDALSIRGDFTNGTVKHGIKRAVVTGLTTIAGDHWQVSGGDGGIFMGGCASQETYYCRHVAARDLGQYFSSDSTGTLQCHVVAIGNSFENCFGAISNKRSNGSVTYQGNDINNCPRALGIEHEIGAGSNRISIMGNHMRSCGTLGRITYANGVSIIGNHATDQGALLADGVSIEGFAGCNGWQLRGVTRGSVAFNTMLGVKAAARAAYPTSCKPLVSEGFNHDTGTVLTSSCVFMFNESDGWNSGGSDSGTNNSFIRNRASNTTSTAFISFTGTGNYEERIDPATNTISYTGPLLVSDGTVALPGVARRGQANTGMFFAANAVGLSAGGVERVRITNNGIGFNGAAPVTRQVYGAPTGTATRATFDTATVTTAQLAERVKALIDDLRANGLMGG